MEDGIVGGVKCNTDSALDYTIMSYNADFL